MSETKTRILRREDGQIFTWSKTLSQRKDMREGWMIIREDGTKTVEVDKPIKKDIDQTTVFAQNQELSNELHAAKKEIAELRTLLGQKGIQVPSSNVVAKGVTKVAELPKLDGHEAIPDLTGDGEEKTFNLDFGKADESVSAPKLTVGSKKK